jgi:RNA polymerase sigma factor (TIGR02999 family)
VAGETTQLLLQVCKGNRDALDDLMPLVYDELKMIAVRRMRAERADHTLQPTALVNEAFLRLVDQTRVQWRGRAHFCAVAANMMRRILVDHARRRAAAKRGADGHKLALNDDIGVTGEPSPVDLVALDDLLEQLAELNQRHARVIELRFFAGMGIDETAHVLGVSPGTVKNDWRAARAWLMSRLREETDDVS